MIFLGTFGPSIAALLLLRQKGEKGDIRKLLKRAVQFKFGISWYIVIFLIVPLGGPIAHLLRSSFFGTNFPQTEALMKPWQIPFVLLFSLILGPISEEFGWRGVAIHGFQTKWNSLTSSLVL